MISVDCTFSTLQRYKVKGFFSTFSHISQMETMHCVRDIIETITFIIYDSVNYYYDIRHVKTFAANPLRDETVLDYTTRHASNIPSRIVLTSRLLLLCTINFRFDRFNFVKPFAVLTFITSRNDVVHLLSSTVRPILPV